MKSRCPISLLLTPSAINFKISTLRPVAVCGSRYGFLKLAITLWEISRLKTDPLWIVVKRASVSSEAVVESIISTPSTIFFSVIPR